MDIERMKDLIAQREAIDAELVALVTGTTKKERKSLTCSLCGGHDHTARICTKKGDASPSTM
jgi:hypothetical protein